MWIEIAGELINLSRVIKVVRCQTETDFSLRLYSTCTEFLEYKFKNHNEIELVYFNLLESIKSKPVDGFIEE
ncbi:MAG: hypothetical protein HY965_00870 [Ignavibacteriales bacterium]|nr:hypothetical protein [Ignavibacteriales bacterium]